MTTRSIVLGLLGACLVCGLTYVNDHVMRQTYLVGSGMPPAAFGGALILLLAINPGLRLLKKRFELAGAEIAVILALTLSACCIPGAGLLETFPDVVMMPHRIAKTDPGWRAEHIVAKAPRHMLTDVSECEDRALTGYVQGLSTPGRRISPSDVPWSAWACTLAFWIPLVLLLWLALLGMSLVVHRHWSDHEQLPFPIATFAESLISGTDHGAAPLYRNRLFWIGCGGVCLVHLVNYAHAWWPEQLVRIPVAFDLLSLKELCPAFVRAGGWEILRPRLYFAVIGLAFLLPRDVSLSLGLGPVMYYTLAGFLAGFGVSMTEGRGWYAADLRFALQAGAYAGILAVIVYTGRSYYANVFRSALGLRHAGVVEPSSAWGARVFMLCSALFAAMLTASGLDWQLSIAFTALVMGIFVVIGRISAETGCIFIQPYWEPAAFIVGLAGMRAIGPSTALIMFFASTVVLIDTREPLMPFVLNSFRILDRRGVRAHKAGLFAGLALVIGLAVAVPTTLYVKYDRGTDLTKAWLRGVPRLPFDATVRVTQRLRAQGELERAESVRGWGRIASASPSGTLLVGFAAALGLYLVLSALRLRFPRWPLHPVFLLLWAVTPSRRFVASFLIGYVVKGAVAKYGGERACRLVKPLMIGLIAADMLFGITTSLVGGIYYCITGTPPPRFVVLVG